MLVTLIRRYSKPYMPYIVAVIVFQLASTIAALYLPSLNAQIIDEGVSRGDTDFIWRTGGVMLVVAFIQVGTAIAGVYFGSKTAMAVGPRPPPRRLPQGHQLLRQGRQHVRRAHPDHPRHQRRPAGADAGADGPELHGGHAHHVHRRHHHGPARGPQPVLAGLGLRSGADRGGRLPRGPPDAAVPLHAEEDRPHQRGPARADHRHPRGPGLRPRAATKPSASARPTRN